MNIIDLAEYRISSGQETDTHSDVQIIEKLLARVRALQTCEAWLQKQVAERDATIESLRLETSQTIDDLRFEVRRAKDERDLWTVKASQLQPLLDN
jgi:predicted RNase H-like nuclease (RuvC/YqgF family)